MKIKSIAWSVGVLAVFSGLVAYRLWPKTDDGPKGAPDPAVSLQQVQPKDVAFNLSLNGAVSSIRTVDVHAQVTNVVKQVLVHEGQFVSQGQVLFTLDDRSDRANVEKLKAQLMRDKALALDQERQFQRAQELKSKNFVSQGSVDTSLSLRDAQLGTVKSDESALEAALIALDFDTIRAPISGRTGIINVFPGTLVVPQTTSLVTVTQLDPISVMFSVPESYLSKLQQALVNAKKSNASDVQAKIPNAEQSVSGHLYFVDNMVDPNSGTIRAKAEFNNSKDALWPGQFVQATLNLGALKDALAIPSKAVVNSPNGKFVYVVGEDQIAIQTPIKQVYLFGEEMVVEGLKAGDQVVTDGKQNVRPNAKVRVVTPGAGKSSANKDASAKPPNQPNLSNPSNPSKP
jgi:RND family efflux transporter MFP subunit